MADDPRQLNPNYIREIARMRADIQSASHWRPNGTFAGPIQYTEPSWGIYQWVDPGAWGYWWRNGDPTGHAEAQDEWARLNEPIHHPFCSAAGFPCPIKCDGWPTYDATQETLRWLQGVVEGLSARLDALEELLTAQVGYEPVKVSEEEAQRWLDEALDPSPMPGVTGSIRGSGWEIPFIVDPTRPPGTWRVEHPTIKPKVFEDAGASTSRFDNIKDAPIPRATKVGWLTDWAEDWVRSRNQQP